MQVGDDRAYDAIVWKLALHIRRMHSLYWVEPRVPHRVDELRTTFE